MIRCFIIDDEKAAISVLKRHIKKLPNLLLIGAETNPLLGIAAIQKEKPDLVFLDIQMSEMSGINVMKIIGPQTKVIFCTAYLEYAVTSYELDAADYLLKPIGFDRFLKAVQKVAATLQVLERQAQVGDYIYVKGKMRGKFQRVDFSEIDYIRARNNFISIHNGNNQVVSYHTLKQIDGILPPDKFMRIHRSYIVSLDKIAEIDNEVIVLKNKVLLPVSGAYRKSFLKKMRRS